MNIYDYLKKYGNKSFEEKEFNEVDNLILSLLSYVSYDGIVHSNKKKVTIGEAGDIYFSKHKSNEKLFITIKDSVELFNVVYKTKRFKQIFMYYYECTDDDNQQFAAVTFELNKKLVYVAFEGTDQHIIGWEEDCMLAYKFPIRSQKSAIRYLNKHFLAGNKKLIVGGHSKGGNLALVASMYCTASVRRKTIKIYSNDGPGLRKSELYSKKYERIEKKFVHIIPSHSIVGLLLRQKYNFKVVKTNKVGIAAHQGKNWLLKDDKFEKAKLSKFSQTFDKGLSQWLDNYDDKQLEECIHEIFIIFKKNNIDSLTEILQNNKTIIALVKETKNMNPNVKKMFQDLLHILIECNKEELTFYINEKLDIKKILKKK